MKKLLSIILALFIALFAFAACKKETDGENRNEKSQKATTTEKEFISDIGGVVVTNFKGEIGDTVLTKKNGEVVRDDAGNLIVPVTDRDGTVIKNDNGEVATQAVAIDNAVVLGNRIEMPDYAINIPDGWSNSASYKDLHIKKDGTEDLISISAKRDEKLADVEAANNEMLELVDSENKVNTTVKVAGKDASFVSAFTTVNGVGVYLGFITFSHQGVVYKCMITSDRDLGGEIDSIIAILNTIEFIH